MYCKHPHTGVTIAPNGDITVCCTNPDAKLGHISNFENLTEEYRKSGLIQDLRKENPDTIKWVCRTCIKREQDGARSRRIRFNKRQLTLDDNKIRYLEITTSNICNQTCSTCFSYFSSKWLEYDEEAQYSFPDRKPHNIYRMNDRDIQKIVDVLSDVEILAIKGGEPFADKNNLKILEELVKVNKDCTVIFTSNLSNIPQKFIDVLKKLNNVTLAASIDGTHKVYEWVRSTPFEKTVNTMQNVYNKTGIKLSLAPTMSLHNVYRLYDIVDYFHDKEYVDSIHFVKFINGPRYANASMISPEERYRIVEEFFSRISRIDYKIPIRNLESIKKFPEMEDISSNYKNQALTWIRYMNMIRNIDLLEVIPELNGFFKNE